MFHNVKVTTHKAHTQTVHNQAHKAHTQTVHNQAHKRSVKFVYTASWTVLFIKYSSNTIRVIKSRSVREAGHLERMTTMINTYRASVRHPEVRDQLEDLGVDETIILEWILKNSIGRAWSGQTWLRIRTCGGSCKNGNETSGSINCGELLGKLRNYQFLKNDSAPWR